MAAKIAEGFSAKVDLLKNPGFEARKQESKITTSGSKRGH